MSRIAIYTAIFENKDKLSIPIFSEKSNVDFFLFTDDKQLSIEPYQTIYIENKYTDSTKMCREIKINLINQKKYNGYDFLIWHDANMQINIDNLMQLVFKCNNQNLSILKHHRSCVYAEAIACIKSNKDKSFKIFRQILRYFLNGMPLNYGLWSTGLLIINNKNVNTSRFMNLWWKETLRHTRRDQLSLPYIAYKEKFKINTINENIYENTYLKYFKHKHQAYIVSNKIEKKDKEVIKKFYILMIKVLRKSLKYKTLFLKKNL